MVEACAEALFLVAGPLGLEKEEEGLKERLPLELQSEAEGEAERVRGLEEDLPPSRARNQEARLELRGPTQQATWNEDLADHTRETSWGRCGRRRSFEGEGRLELLELELLDLAALQYPMKTANCTKAEMMTNSRNSDRRSSLISMTKSACEGRS